MVHLYEAYSPKVLYPQVDMIDKDEVFWRPLTTGRQQQVEELMPHTRTRMIRIARYLWITNPLAHRIIEHMVSFTVGAGITFKAHDKSVQACLDSFWDDPVNNWKNKLPDRVRNLCLYGEQFYPVQVNNVTGQVRLTYLNPLDVVETRVDKWNVEIIRELKISPDIISSGHPDWFSVINYNSETEKREGEVLTYAINKSPDATRGCSDLLPMLDWINLHDQLLFNSLERSAHLNSWLWDVTLEDMNDSQIKDWLNSTQANVPRPGSIRAHNQKVTWQAIAPNLQAQEMSDSADQFKRHILGGAGMPEYFFSEPPKGGTSRSGMQEMVEPTFKTFQLRQQYIKSMFSDMFMFVIDMAKTHGMLNDVTDFSFDIYMPRISLRDVQRTGGAMLRVAQSLQLAQQNGWIDGEQSHQVFVFLIDQLGVVAEIREINGTGEQGGNPDDKINGKGADNGNGQNQVGADNQTGNKEKGPAGNVGAFEQPKGGAGEFGSQRSKVTGRADRTEYLRGIAPGLPGGHSTGSVGGNY